jgi:hypothetical protein
MNNKNDLIKRFLDTRALIDSQPTTKPEPKKDVANVVSTAAPLSGVRHIINTKPKNKVVIEFLRGEVAKLIDDTDSD